MDTTPYYSPAYFAPAYFAPMATNAAPPVAGPSPYFAPTYFAPTYFAPTATNAAPPVAGPSPYFAPTYFAPSYFANGQAAPMPPVVVPPSGRDEACYAALLALLGGTGAFDEVLFGVATSRGKAGAGDYPVAVVTPRGWDEVDDYDPTLILRRVLFNVRIVVRADDQGRPFEQLDLLASTVQAALDRSSLDGTCLPALTKIRAGRYEVSPHYPEQCIDLEGEFSTLFDPAATQAASA